MTGVSLAAVRSAVLPRITRPDQRVAARPKAGTARAAVGSRAGSFTAPILRLQTMAGNRSVARVVRGDPSVRVLQRQSATRKWQIVVHPSSQLDADAIVKIVKGNPNLDSWLTDGFSAAGGSIALSPKLAQPPKSVPNEYLGSLKKAFESGNWVLTTAELRITAKALKDPPTDAQDWSWTKVTVPDLSQGEELGTWGKTGFHATPMISGGAPAVDFGETPGISETSTLGPGVSRGYLVIVNRVTAEAPDGQKRTFTPSDDDIAETFLHEIAAHAGQHELGKPDEHGKGRVNAIDTEIRDLFRDSKNPGLTSAPITAFLQQHLAKLVPPAGTLKK
jgi:hypothetical protein